MRLKRLVKFSSINPKITPKSFWKNVRGFAIKILEKSLKNFIEEDIIDSHECSIEFLEDFLKSNTWAILKDFLGQHSKMRELQAPALTINNRLDSVIQSVSSMGTTLR